MTWRMGHFLSLCGGFLLAVLWFDLMFDTQTLGAGDGVLPEDMLASIAAYYARVTGSPMRPLVGAVMVLTLAGTAYQLATGALPRLLAAVAALTSVAPIVLAMMRVLPAAMRLGRRADAIEIQSALARSICRAHLFCLGAILVFCVVQVVAAA